MFRGGWVAAWTVAQAVSGAFLPSSERAGVGGRVVLVCRRGVCRSASGGERSYPRERSGEVALPGPAGGEVKRPSPGGAGEPAGDLQ